MRIRPAKCLKGEIVLPGDKSISHRAAIIAAMAQGETRISNFGTSADCGSTLECLRRLGVSIRRDGETVWIIGVGKSGFQEPGAELDCGNSGTTMRLLAGVLAGRSFESVLTGDESLSRRPMTRVIDPLTSMGASIESEDGHAPLTIRARSQLRAIDYRLPVASAQIKSCILLAGLNADGETVVREPVPTRDHTERMLRWFGVDVIESTESGERTVAVMGGASLKAADVVVPADISSAAFFLVAAIGLAGSRLSIRNVGLNPTRAAIIQTLSDFGAGIRITSDREHNNEPVADLVVESGLVAMRGGALHGGVIPNLIDELPILAVLGTRLEGGIEVREARELRVKETDRIAAVCENLRRMGADVEEFEDGFRVGRSDLRGTTVDSFGDHRIAMAFAIAGLMAVEGETEITGAECAGVSFPRFFDVLEDVVVYE